MEPNIGTGLPHQNALCDAKIYRTTIAAQSKFYSTYWTRTILCITKYNCTWAALPNAS
jgi:hypothetical protein